ncbi:MAG: recombination mediator RecR [Candidatus Marinimicrobia bacterium]|jgi:recombination protein RecR|nr:recombination mediator RecR [Candidatus Neomarinimicrobiota bacterium]MDX9778547.1 recombination mediator RecR [bacterium]
MAGIPEVITRVEMLFSKFPGIGRKSARRIAFYLMDREREDVIAIAKALVDLKDKITHCPICNHITEQTPCDICGNPKRDDSILCVVEDSMDVIALEKSVSFRGKYHVLGGLISPLDGVGPDDLAIDALFRRLEPVKEVIIAINPSVEGDTTTFYLSRLLKDYPLKVTRLARGIPVGGDLEYTDEATLARALEGRLEIPNE